MVLIKLIFFISLLILATNASWFGSVQSIAVEGQIFCDWDRPAANVQVKLMEDDRGPNMDDFLMSGYTDEDGRFQLYGSEEELTTIDPVLKIYHDCNDGAIPCQKKWAITIPDEYISKGTTPKKTFFLGVLNLMVELDRDYIGQERDCIH